MYSFRISCGFYFVDRWGLCGLWFEEHVGKTPPVLKVSGAFASFRVCQEVWCWKVNLLAFGYQIWQDLDTEIQTSFCLISIKAKLSAGSSFNRHVSNSDCIWHRKDFVRALTVCTSFWSLMSLDQNYLHLVFNFVPKLSAGTDCGSFNSALGLTEGRRHLSFLNPGRTVSCLRYDFGYRETFPKTVWLLKSFTESLVFFMYLKFSLRSGKESHAILS